MFLWQNSAQKFVSYLPNMANALSALWAALRRRPAPASSEALAVDGQGQPHQLTLYKFDACPYCQRVMHFLHDTGIPVTYKDIQKTPALRQELISLGGKGQVPCLRIGDQMLYESADILAYLRDFQRP